MLLLYFSIHQLPQRRPIGRSRISQKDYSVSPNLTVGTSVLIGDQLFNSNSYLRNSLKHSKKNTRKKVRRHCKQCIINEKYEMCIKKLPLNMDDGT